MGRRWSKIETIGNDGEKLEAWELDGLQILLNINHGRVRRGVRDRHGNRWWFEVTDERECHVGQAPSLSEAKAIGRAVIAGKEPLVFTPVLLSEGQPVARPTVEPAKPGLLSGLRRFVR